MQRVTDVRESRQTNEFWREACNGLQAVRVAALFPCSLRQAYNRFRRATGRSILEEIHAVQLERAKELLRDPSIQLKVISDFCGFTNPNSLRKFFHKATGMTMAAWRDEEMPDGGQGTPPSQPDKAQRKVHRDA